ncbi:hypothetical protein JYU34_016135 [Plutella xylostella]|uniref:Uncharacterized protein n=1 Tax=Plutella xylostella TaxID=51655 RepID=A0ABQ7Q5I5_PLUXY|nr:uncharacterized protein LOC105385614 [Plutella xylostella]KAG7300505.1 hypothetical protein JYU34_016135 [Plutella xylostella]
MILSCPITAGTYKLQSYPYNTRDNHLTGESKISTSMYGYTFRLEGYDISDEKILCVDSTLQLVYLRKNEFVEEEEDNVEDP